MSEQDKSNKDVQSEQVIYGDKLNKESQTAFNDALKFWNKTYPLLDEICKKINEELKDDTTKTIISEMFMERFLRLMELKGFTVMGILKWVEWSLMSKQFFKVNISSKELAEQIYTKITENLKYPTDNNETSYVS